MSDIESIELWHRRARPTPDHEDFNVQLGCHFEEIAEMLMTLEGENSITNDKLAQARLLMDRIAEGFKMGIYSCYALDRKEFMDSIADQVVTGIGAAYCADMKPAKAIQIVNTSNWSKFDTNGEPYKDANGKIKKGPNYVPPHLDDCV